MEIHLTNDSALGKEMARLARELAVERVNLPSEHPGMTTTLTRVIEDLLGGTSAEADAEVVERVAYFAAAWMLLLGSLASLLNLKVGDPDYATRALQIASQKIEAGDVGFM